MNPLVKDINLTTEKKKSYIYFVLLVVVASLIFVSLSYPYLMGYQSKGLIAGSVSSSNIEAPYTLTYASDILTKAAIEQKIKSISPVYLPADSDIARLQQEKLQNSLDYITIVRKDIHSTLYEKLEDLSKDAVLQPSEIFASQLLALSDEDWELIRQEAKTVLAQIMKNTIQDSQLEDGKKNVPGLISYTFTRQLASLTASVVTPFIISNSHYSPELTQVAVNKAAENVPPVSKTYIQGQMIVTRGQIITPEIEEALKQFGLIRNNSASKELIATGSLTILAFSVLLIYFSRRSIITNISFSNLLLISIFFFLFLIPGRLLIQEHSVLPYVFPLAAFGLIIASLFSPEPAIVLTSLLAVLTGYGTAHNLDLTLFYWISGIAGILILWRGLRITSFIWSGLIIGLIGVIIIVAYRVTDPYTDLTGLLTLIGAVLLNGLTSASLALLLQFIFTQLFGFATPLHLIELSRSDHPLLQFILQNAPGTYQHSLQVANMAELAAKAIGADPYLIRAGALFHDAGKALNPQYFIENQLGHKPNPHNDLTPEESARIIISHITDGITLAKKYRLPANVINFISEHHGTSITRFQYNKAVEIAEAKGEKVDQLKFRYAGPKPQSKETALLMLADTAEAKARADQPRDEDALRETVRKAIEVCLQQGQLNETNLTFLDLNKTIDSFVFTLQNTYHPRIRYPEIKKDTKPLPVVNGDML